VKDKLLSAIRNAEIQERSLRVFEEALYRGERFLEATTDSDVKTELTELYSLRRRLLENWKSFYRVDYVEYLKMRIQLELVQQDTQRSKRSEFEKQVICSYEALYLAERPDSTFYERSERLARLGLAKYKDYRAYRKAVQKARVPFSNLLFMEYLKQQVRKVID
jgi:hypothetical protein